MAAIPVITAAMLPDGRRLHLQHGPIDLIVEATGEPGEAAAAYQAARSRFDGILTGLVDELPMLRTPLFNKGGEPAPQGPVARRMLSACWPLRDNFITPMAAVAGAVADEVLDAMTAAATLRRAYVNNGGDIALHLARGESFTTGIVPRGDDPCAVAPAHRVQIAHAQPTRGVATSGWRGRSWSLGIADSVTVLGRSAAVADAAATLVANATNVDNGAITRAPARSLDESSDLGDRLVTVAVGALDRDDVETALAGGERIARNLVARGLIDAALITLDSQTRLVDTPMQHLAA